MFEFKLDMICMQEAHRDNSIRYISDGGLTVILSGDEGIKFAGVGFLVAHWINR